MTPVIIRLNWGKDEDMTQVLRARISKLPHDPTGDTRWEAVSISALRDEVVVLVVSKDVE